MTLLGLALALTVSIVAADLGVPAGALADPQAPRPVPGRLVVRYRPDVGACVRCALAPGRSPAMATGSAALDRLHAQLGVRGMRPLFLDEHALAGRTPAAAYGARVAAARARHAVRTGRAPAGRTPPDLSGVYVLEIDPAIDVRAAAARYAADPAVTWAHPDHEVRVSYVPNDPYFATVGTWGQPYADLWGLHRIGAEQAWDVATGAGTVIAIVDTGVDPTHPDVAANLWANPGEIPANGVDDDGNGFVDDVRGWDFDATDADPRDEHGHGTHVAGIAAAAGNNGIGVVGLAFGARIMAVRGLGASGVGFTSNLAAAIVYAAENGADVINASWGGPASLQVLIEAVDTATSLGAVVVAAAGNDGGDVGSVGPAALPGVIAVAATDPTDAPASFSNGGDAIAVSAPGVDVLSARFAGWIRPEVVAGEYLHVSGTSMAAPHVAGLAALLLSALPALDLDEVRWHLELNADQPGIAGYEGRPWNPRHGWGRIDAAHVFAPPPATTRLPRSGLELHEFAGTSRTDVAEANLAFTTHAAVGWSVTTPPWLTSTPASGDGATTLALSYDGTATVGGTSDASTLDVSAPAAVDGGASLPVTLHTHRDERIGSEILVDADGDAGASPSFGPKIAHNGTTALVVWARRSAGTPAILAATLDAAGNLGSPVVLDSGRIASYFDVGSDGNGFLVFWLVGDPFYGDGPPASQPRALALRLDAGGTPIDPAPIEIDAAPRGGILGYRYLLYSPSVAFDGQSYALLWERTIPAGLARQQYWFRRVLADGSLTKSRRFRRKNPRGLRVRSGSFSSPRLVCLPGACLFAWSQADAPPGAFVGKASTYGMPVVDDRPVTRRAARLLHDAGGFHEWTIAAGGGGYLVAGMRSVFVSDATGTGFARDVVAARITADGVPLEPEGVRVHRDPGQRGTARRPWSIAHDGMRWLVTFTSGPESGASSRAFVARIGADGSVVDSEAEALLLHAGATATAPAIVVTGTHALAAWRDRRLVPGSAPYPFGSIHAQRLLSLAP